MPHNSSQWVNHSFGGGWATDYGQTFYGSPDGSDLVLPWLNKAENITYTLDGRIASAPGTTTLSAASPPMLPLRSMVNGDTLIRGLAPYTLTGSSATTIISVGEDLFKYDGAAFSRIGSVTPSVYTNNICFSQFNDFLVIAQDGPVAPQSWDGTTFQPLAGGPTSFAITHKHRGRQWGANTDANPSRLYYSVSGDPEDWVGVGSGSIDVDPGDGDEITGIYSFQGELFIFKGSTNLSIYRLTGSTSSDFALVPFTRNISAAWQTSIFQYNDDLIFWSPYGSLHSLKTTDRYGNFVQSYLNYPILSWCQEHMGGAPDRWQGAVDPRKGYGAFNFFDTHARTSPQYGVNANNMTMMMDFRFMNEQNPYPRFALWPYLQCHSVGLTGSESGNPRFWMGDEWGDIHSFDQVWTVDSSGNTYGHRDTFIRSNVTTPFLSYGPPVEVKTITHVSVNLSPTSHDTTSVRFHYANESGGVSVMDLDRGFGVPLGTFVLDTDSLAVESSRVISYEPMVGEFRAAQYSLTVEDNKKFIIDNFGVLITPAGESLAS